MSREIPTIMPNHNLSRRELEVLKLASQKYLSKEIADKLELSVNTIRNHRSNIFSKLEVHDITGAVAIAKERGLI